MVHLLTIVPAKTIQESYGSKPLVKILRNVKRESFLTLIFKYGRSCNGHTACLDGEILSLT